MNHHWQIERIPNKDFVLRQVHHEERYPSGGRRIPSEAAFKLRLGETGLSVNWDKYMSIKENYIYLGLSYTPAGRFFEYTAFKIFKLKVEFIRSVTGIEDILHNPVFWGDPPPIGKRNNHAHSIVLYEDDEEVRMNLADYCNKNYDISYCDFNIKSIKEEINNLRQRLIDNNG